MLIRRLPARKSDPRPPPPNHKLGGDTPSTPPSLPYQLIRTSTPHRLEHTKYPNTQHPTTNKKILLHAQDGRVITKMTKARLRKLATLYRLPDNQTPLQKALANLTHKHPTIGNTHTQTTETTLYKPYKLYPEEFNNGTWPIPDTIYDALHICFNIQRVIHCNTINLPLRAKTYISHDPQDAVFLAFPYTKSAWPGTSLALPEYKADKLKTALEQVIYKAYAHRHTTPSRHILMLPNWIHTP